MEIKRILATSDKVLSAIERVKDLEDDIAKLKSTSQLTELKTNMHPSNSVEAVSNACYILLHEKRAKVNIRGLINSFLTNNVYSKLKLLKLTMNILTVDTIRL